MRWGLQCEPRMHHKNLVLVISVVFGGFLYVRFLSLLFNLCGRSLLFTSISQPYHIPNGFSNNNRSRAVYRPSQREGPYLAQCH